MMPSGAGPYAGAPVGGSDYAYSPVSRSPRLARHLQAVGILWLLFGSLRVLGGLASMFFLSAWTRHRLPFGIPFPTGNSGFPTNWLVFFIPLIETVTMVSAALAFASGLGLLYRKPWGRVVALIAGVLALFSFPFGTALGIYTLIVLVPAAAAAEYDGMAVR